jgi:hypothetical protein
MEWLEIEKLALRTYLDKKLPKEYYDRLKIEISEIKKQGVNAFWVENYNAKKTWPENPNGLVFPWLLGMTPIDPITTKFVYKEDETGEVGEMVILTLENGTKVEIPRNLNVKLSNNMSKSVSELMIGDDLEIIS